MAWLGKVSLGNFSSDIAGAVTKLSESVKSIERNFDSALGFEDKTEDKRTFLDAIVSSASQVDLQVSNDGTGGEPAAEATLEVRKDTEEVSVVEPSTAEGSIAHAQDWEELKPSSGADVITESSVHQADAQTSSAQVVQDSHSDEALEECAYVNVPIAQATEKLESDREGVDAQDDGLLPKATASENAGETFHEVSASEISDCTPTSRVDTHGEETIHVNEAQDVDKVKSEFKVMENALQGAAKQAQMKADEIARLHQENDQLKCALEEAKRKSSEVELEALREEYQHRLGAANRKVYALTKERDMLRREQNRKTDSSALLKEKDEIIKQVMAEGEELSKKQAAQEAQIRKLRAQVRELEEEKQRLNSRLQVEEAKVESIRKDKAATEKTLQETVEKGHTDLAAQREFYTKIVNEAREAEARAEARANTQAKADLDHRLREAAEREAALVQALEELRQGLSRTEQQAAFHEDVLRKDIEDLERRCQAAEARYDELVARVPESTRPLLRQIEAMQESSAMRAEAWTGVERALNSRLQEAEAKAAAAQERERAINERLSQTLSRIAVMEAQVSCLKAEQSQLTRSLEKERVRASENRQECLAALETAATHEGRAKQLEQELQGLKEKHVRVLAEEKSQRIALEQELEKERESRTEFEQRLQSEARGRADVPSHSLTENSSNRSLRRLSSASSGNSVEESHFLQASLDLSSAAHERFKFSEPLSPHFAKGMVSAATMEQFEALLRQKEGELYSYAARLAELESTRGSLAEELVRTTTQCEKLQSEASHLRGLRAEMEALRRRHASALELMGERDEQVEELRADLADVKQMYREQIDMLVGQIERLSGSRNVQ